MQLVKIGNRVFNPQQIVWIELDCGDDGLGNTQHRVYLEGGRLLCFIKPAEKLALETWLMPEAVDYSALTRDWEAADASTV